MTIPSSQGFKSSASTKLTNDGISWTVETTYTLSEWLLEATLHNNASWKIRHLERYDSISNIVSYNSLLISQGKEAWKIINQRILCMSSAMQM